MRKYPCLWLMLTLFLHLQCTAGVQELTTDEVHARLETGDTLLLLDVREVREYTAGHIAEPAGKLPITPLLMPWSSNVLHRVYTALPKDRDIILYCRSGRRSAAAAAFLQENGYSRVYNMSGGFLAWSYESRSGGFGDHSGRWIRRSDLPVMVESAPESSCCISISYPASALPENIDSVYLEVHTAQKPEPPVTGLPEQAAYVFFRLTLLDPFGMSLFRMDSVLLPDAVSLELWADQQDAMPGAPNLYIYKSRAGWQRMPARSASEMLRRKTVVLFRWYAVGL